MLAFDPLVKVWELQFSAVLPELVCQRNSAVLRHARLRIVDAIAGRFSSTGFPDVSVLQVSGNAVVVALWCREALRTSGMNRNGH